MTLPTVILPGYFARSLEYQPLETALNAQGIPTVTVPLSKRDWLPTLGGRSVAPILRRIDQTVQQVRTKYQTDKVNLIGHSAGGWIARIYLGEKPYGVLGETWEAQKFVAALITLGTPHLSQERWTKRNLDFVKYTYPGAFYPHIRYVCVAGKAIYGQPGLENWLAYNSYKLTLGEGKTWGDGITPIAAAHLEGAINLTLDKVLHAPLSSGPWYGSEGIREQWLDYLL
jgi:pimeloyl-ACP methyl ester carboxylesterase